MSDNTSLPAGDGLPEEPLVFVKNWGAITHEVVYKKDYDLLRAAALRWHDENIVLTLLLSKASEERDQSRAALAEAAARDPGHVLAVGEKCVGDWDHSGVWPDRGWMCRCGAKSPSECRTETALPDPTEGGR